MVKFLGLAGRSWTVLLLFSLAIIPNAFVACEPVHSPTDINDIQEQNAQHHLVRRALFRGPNTERFKYEVRKTLSRTTQGVASVCRGASCGAMNLIEGIGHGAAACLTAPFAALQVLTNVIENVCGCHRCDLAHGECIRAFQKSLQKSANRVVGGMSCIFDGTINGVGNFLSAGGHLAKATLYGVGAGFETVGNVLTGIGRCVHAGCYGTPHCHSHVHAGHPPCQHYRHHPPHRFYKRADVSDQPEDEEPKPRCPFHALFKTGGDSQARNRCPFPHATAVQKPENPVEVPQVEPKETKIEEPVASAKGRCPFHRAAQKPVELELESSKVNEAVAPEPTSVQETTKTEPHDCLQTEEHERTEEITPKKQCPFPHELFKIDFSNMCKAWRGDPKEYKIVKNGWLSRNRTRARFNIYWAKPNSTESNSRIEYNEFAHVVANGSVMEMFNSLNESVGMTKAIHRFTPYRKISLTFRGSIDGVYGTRVANMTRSRRLHPKQSYHIVVPRNPPESLDCFITEKPTAETFDDVLACQKVQLEPNGNIYLKLKSNVLRTKYTLYETPRFGSSERTRVVAEFNRGIMNHVSFSNVWYLQMKSQEYPIELVFLILTSMDSW